MEDALLQLLFVVITCGKSKFMSPEKPGKLGEFFSLLLCGRPVKLNDHQRDRFGGFFPTFAVIKNTPQNVTRLNQNW